MKIIDISSLTKKEKKAIDECIKAREKGYAPYSKFKVGASVISVSGKIYKGCNVESADYTLTAHAEMNAINSMILAGERYLKSIFVCFVSKELPVPCGLCRQKILEFSKNSEISIFGIQLSHKCKIEKIFHFTLKELLPFPFSKSQFKESN